MPTQLAYISPNVLRWARVRSQLSREETATKAGVKLEQLTLWESENGDSRPTFRQAQKLANLLRVPFGYLFLSSPPNEIPALPDLRTVTDAKLNSFSADFLELLNDVLLKQQWYQEYLKEEGSEEIAFIGKFEIRNSHNQIAEDICRQLEINDDLRREGRNWEGFLRTLINRVQQLQILVLRSGIVKNSTNRKLLVSEFRGFAISSAYAPLIFLNGNDAKAAQIFTLIHELAHLWIGKSGISNQDLSDRSLSHNQQIERLCNKVAAEVLVPASSLNVEWKNNRTVDDNVYHLVRRYRVSSLVILKSALDLQKITWRQYIRCYNSEREEYLSRERKQQSGGDFHVTLESRNSPQIIRAVVSSAFEGRLLYRDAARLLSVKVSTLEKVAKKIGVRQ